MKIKGLILHFCFALTVLLVLAAGQSQPADVGELFASETTAHGPALLAGTGMSVASGSQVAAGRSVATLRLTRGGELRICPNASVTVSAVQNNMPQRDQELMLAMDTGSVEFDYPINDLADTLITPDFKLMLAGPGVFHFAVGVNNHGDTCIKPLRGNSASIIVTEMLGNSVYQVKPDEAVMFPGGKLAGRSPLEADCGCPTPPPVLQAKETEPPKPAEQAATSESSKPKEPPAPAERPKRAMASPGIPAPVASASAPSGAAASPPAERAGPTHVQVDVPLVYRGDQPGPVYAVARLRFSALPNVFLAQEDEKPLVLKPGKGEVSAKHKEKKGFFGKIKGFFAALFGK